MRVCGRALAAEHHAPVVPADRGVIWADVEGWRRIAVGVAPVHSD